MFIYEYIVDLYFYILILIGCKTKFKLSFGNIPNDNWLYLYNCHDCDLLILSLDEQELNEVFVYLEQNSKISKVQNEDLVKELEYEAWLGEIKFKEIMFYLDNLKNRDI